MRRVSKLTHAGCLAAATFAGEVHAANESTVTVAARHVSAQTAFDKHKVGEAWEVSVGLGYSADPEFEGARRYAFGTVPAIDARWGRLSFDGGLHVAVIDRETTTVSLGLAYDDGRHDRSGQHLNGSGSNYLRGLGRIGSAAVVSVSGEQSFGPLSLSTTVSRWLGSENFMTADIALEVGVPVTDALSVGASIGSTWANKDYNQAYFGVTAAQASHSRFRVFDAGGGVKSATASLFAEYALSRHWSVAARAGASTLLGDAANSPIVQSRIGREAMLVLSYQF